MNYLDSSVEDPRFITSKEFFEKGIVNFENRDFQEATKFFRLAYELQPQRISILTNLTSALIKIDSLSEAESLISNALNLYPADPILHLNLGNLYFKLHNWNESLSCYKKAISLDNNYAEAYNNCGLTYKELNFSDDSIFHYKKAISLNPNYVEAYYNLACLYQSTGSWDAALDISLKGLHIDANFEDLFISYLGFITKLCKWDSLSLDIANLVSRINSNYSDISPFRPLSLIDRSDLHLIAAQTYAASECPSDDSLGPIPLRPSDGKIRVGYYSADFHNHATAFLMAELFELHDKSKFEFYAFSFGPNINDDMRQRLSSSFYQFIDVTNTSDRDVAILSRQMGIDIAVDLKGYTQDSRANIFAKRCAPIQVSYLGYPGTMGVDYMDYIIADKVVIPESNQHFFTEKVVYLPNSYQVNDSKRVISDRVFSKNEVGIPDNAFVFCCFNNNYKILPDTFDIWMRILQSVPNSVLWLLDDNPTATSNLINEAASRGVDGKRLIFAKRIRLDEHLARHRLADLFLDTLPYNAHTTTSDALWAGLPVLTCTGQSFASRVAASLLDAIGLPELITHNAYDYEQKALELANNPFLLVQIKSKLASNRLTTPLFDTQLFTQHIEEAYLQMYQLQQSNLSPQHIFIVPSSF
jgi:predicted O-linked N-acetylglucosamine transferase (SPINDLY family)